MSMMPDLPDKPLKILIIDDEPVWCESIGMCAELLGYMWESASSFEKAKIALKEAEEEGTPFSVATIDMAFEVGKRGTETPLGKGILQYIKSKHPYIACIMVSGSPEVAHQVLDLRDDYELDSFISKDRFDLDTFGEEIAKAIKRVRPLGNEEMAKEIIPAGMAKIVKSLQRQLDAHCSNLDNLEEQRATFAKGEEPLRLLNQIDHEKKEIERLQAELRKFKEAPDHTDST
jgi:DNA-binding NtrC family response regulator